MNKILKNKIADKLVNAFLKNKIVSPLPQKITKKLTNADEFRKLCESKINEPIIGFKAGGTGIPVMKKLKEKEPFYFHSCDGHWSEYGNNFAAKVFLDHYKQN